MNFKTLSQPAYPTVLLFRSFTKKGKIAVTILAFGYDETTEEQDAEASERIEFHSIASAKSYISDFTEKKAADWCTVRGLTLDPQRELTN